MDTIVNFILSQESIKVIAVLVGLFFIFSGVVGEAGINKAPLTKDAKRVLLFLGLLLFSLGVFIEVLPGTIGQRLPTTEAEEWISSGERTLIRSDSNVQRDRGVRSFERRRYSEAEEAFRAAAENEPNNPEIQIYRENARLRQEDEGSYFKIAAVVPAENGQQRAEAFLRGIADAQEDCNGTSLNSRSMEIVIADDADNEGRASRIAEQLSATESVIGVIGHYSSSKTEVGLRKYEPSGIAVVSPTSTSKDIDSDVFFRTTPSDEKAGRELATHAARDYAINRVAGIFNSEDSYSKSLWTVFRDDYKSFGGSVVKELDLALNFSMNDWLRMVEDSGADTLALFPDTRLLREAIAIASAVRENEDIEGEKTALIGGSTLYDPLVLQSGNTLQDAVVAVPWFSSEDNAYARRGKDKWEGALNWISAMSFDAAKAMCQAANESTELTRSNLLANLETLRLPEGETSGGSLSFDARGESGRDVVFVRIAHRSEGDVETPLATNYGFKLVEPRS